MKKLILFASVLLLAFLFGCQGVSTAITTTNTTGQPTTDLSTSSPSSTGTTSSPLTTNTTLAPTTMAYDPRSLVPEDCQYLDNIGDWQPVWSDEFDYTGLPDSNRWLYDTGAGGWGNNELQYYTKEDLDNAYVSDGTLKITALKENYLGSDYTSARLITKYHGDWLYGKIQIRAKLPSGAGTWPALWMLPTDWVYGGWPYSGEIDIMEHVGKDPLKVYGTLHTGAYNGKIGNQIGYSKTVADAESAFHVYEIEWEPARMQVFVDGVSYGVFGYNPLYNVDVSNSDAWPFDQRFHLLMNLAIGGNWGGTVDPDIFPTTLEVDYVRVYQKDYAGMDREAPSAPTDLSLLDATPDSIKVYWTKATDDVMVKEYEIYVDSALVGTTTLNAFRAEGLDPETSYRFDVVAVDFAGHRSTEATLNVQTQSVPSILGIIQAEDYTSQSGVAREDCTDIGGGLNVGWIDTNDYMEYVLMVPEDGTYTITYRVASESGGGEIKLYGKTALPLATTEVPVTGGWQTWTDVESSTFNLTAGLYTFKVKASIGGFNLNYFEFKKVNG